ncbi:MAG: SusD/RagB family nutrient-binding outer membrane lipoprotein [Bacteroidales bacterium]
MKRLIYILIAACLTLMYACEKDFLDINRNPNVPFEANVEHLLTGAQTNLALANGSGNFISTPLNVYVHQLTARESSDQYGLTASSVLLGNSWWYFYTWTLPNLDAIISMAEDSEQGQRWKNHAAVAKILKAFMFTQLVDIWGDVPFSEANKNQLGIIHPKPEAGDVIYNACFDLLDEAMQMLDPSAEIRGDLIYGGNMAKWNRLANSLKLNMLNKTRLRKSQITDWAGKLNAVMSSAVGFIQPDEHFELFYTASVAPDQRHPGFTDGAYVGSQLGQYISPWIYEIMNGLTFNATNNPFADLQDPRVPYYWVNQLEPGQYPDNPHEYKHGQFVSIFFGSIGPYRDMGQDAAASTVGIYPVGGKFDDGQGGRLSVADGTGVAPQKFLTYPEFIFTLAELELMENNNEELAKDYLRQGIEASLSHIDHVVAKSGTRQEVPQLNNQHDSFIDAIISRFESASGEKKFEIIMTQKWIAAFYNPILNYADFRRTGYPVLFDPNTIAISPDPFDPETPQVPTQLTRQYPASMWYPQREVELNPNIIQKTSLPESYVFWQQ